MKVILIKQVPKLGNPTDVVEVAPGYARNFLISKGFAREATNKALDDTEKSKIRKQRQNDLKEKKKNVLRNILENKEILIRAQANNEGILFGGIGKKEIVDSIEKRKKIKVDEKQIDLVHHLKKLGKHELNLKIGGEDKIKFIVDIQKT